MPSPKSSKRADLAKATEAPFQLDLLWPVDAVGLMAGVDEAGRGPLAGPVVAAAVVLGDQQPITGLADLEELTVRRRPRLDGGQ